MAHTRKDTWCKPSEWWKHLRPFLKKLQSKRERKGAKERVNKGNDE